VNALSDIRWRLAVPLLVCWAIYLFADTFVTPAIRIPIPPAMAVLACMIGPKGMRGGLWQLMRPPRWSYPLVAIFLLQAFRDPGANALFYLVFITALMVFRTFAPDTAGYDRLCRLLYGVLVASSVLLLLSQIQPALGLGVRVLLFGQGVLERPYPAGFAQLVHTYGYQVAALGAISLVLAAHNLDGAKRRQGVALIVLSHAGAVLLFGMQRSAVIGATAAWLWVVRRMRAQRFAYIAVVGTTVMLGIILVLPLQQALETTVVGKDQQDTSKSMRWQLQAETVQIILEHPWGLMVEGRTWTPDLFRWGGALSSTGLSGHNAFLMTIAFLGLPSLLLIGWTLGKGIAWMNSLGAGSMASPWPMAMAAVFLATTVNALFHNSSLFSAEGSTMIAYVALGHWNDLRREGDRN